MSYNYLKNYLYLKRCGHIGIYFLGMLGGKNQDTKIIVIPWCHRVRHDLPVEQQQPWTLLGV